MSLSTKIKGLGTNYLTKAVLVTAVVFSVLATSYQTVSGQSFTEISTSLPSILGGSVAWGDYDNDNSMDVLVSGFDPSLNPSSLTPVCKVFRNDHFGNFVDIRAADLPAIKGGLANWVDYNNDGLLDIFLTGETTNGLRIARIYRNEGGGTL